MRLKFAKKAYLCISVGCEDSALRRVKGELYPYLHSRNAPHCFSLFTFHFSLLIVAKRNLTTSPSPTLSDLVDLSALAALQLPAGDDLPNHHDNEPSDDDSTPPPRQQELRIWLEKKHRGGKEATLVRGFVGSDAALEALAKKLKAHLATGGTAKEGELIMQGDQRDRLLSALLSWGYKAKKAGG